MVTLCRNGSHRVLQARLGHIAADRRVLGVFTSPVGSFLVLALQDGLLGARALHRVHVYGARPCRGSAGRQPGALAQLIYTATHFTHNSQMVPKALHLHQSEWHKILC